MPSETLEIGGCEILVERLGAGAPLVVIHGDEGPRKASAFLEKLAERFEVHLPRLPGWPETRRAAHVRTIRDVALVAQEYLERVTDPAGLVGISVGGWVAAEIAATAPRLVTKLALVSPVGIKIGGREDRDFDDFYLLPEPDRSALFYAPGHTPVLRSDANVDIHLEKAVADEAIARFCWQPFFHDPTLAGRLRRIAAETLILSGERDRFVLNPGYYDGYAALIQGAHHETIPGAGHRLEEEAPEAAARRIADFIGAAGESSERGRLAKA